MAQRTIWMISGNKGGVGKSLFCHALASTLEMRGESFAVMDGDGRSKDVFQTFLRKCPAQSVDFRDLQPDSPSCPRDGPYEEVVRKLLTACDHLIINTPDGADQVLKRWFDRTLSHAEFSNNLFKFIYLMSDRPDGLDMLPTLAKSFSYLYPVRNLHFTRNAAPDHLFAAFGKYAAMFNEVVDFPVLRSEETRMLFDLHTYPAEAIRLKGGRSGRYALPALSRARLLTWMGLVEDAFGNIVDKTEPNVRMISVE